MTLEELDRLAEHAKRLEQEKLDWKDAEAYLKECEAACAKAGSGGRFALNLVINPLRDRFNKGERTPELYKEIYEISL